MKFAKHSWTKDEIKALVNVWESKTLDQISAILDIRKANVQVMAAKLRKAGMTLTKKKTKGTLDLLIAEVVSELKNQA